LYGPRVESVASEVVAVADELVARFGARPEPFDVEDDEAPDLLKVRVVGRRRLERRQQNKEREDRQLSSEARQIGQGEGPYVDDPDLGFLGRDGLDLER
jgi:hypothetical protein